MEKEETFQDKIYKATKSYQQVLQLSHDQALEQNESQGDRWRMYRREHEELSARLLSLRDEVTHAVMVPLGRRALMRGHLTHTNELLVCLGDGWFAEQSAKQAADICQRRIQSCDEMLEKLEKERELLASRKTFPFENDTFGLGQTQEIIEPYEEEEEKKWKERHRQKEREYRQKLAELKKTQPTQIETEEDLWKRLNDLDLQEELEDELNRMCEDEEDDDEDSEDENEDSTSSENSHTRLSGKSEEVEKKTLKRRVSFKEDSVSCNNLNEVEKDSSKDELDEDLIRITFKHSHSQSYGSLERTNEVICPSGIYTQYLKGRLPKSILKPSQSVETLSDIPFVPPELKSDQAEVFQQCIEPAVKAVCEEVVERTMASTSSSNSERPVSRFKAARMANKK